MPSEAATPAPVAALTYEAARAQLVEAIGQLERGGLPLDRAIATWQRAEALADHCETTLAGARATLEATVAASTATPIG